MHAHNILTADEIRTILDTLRRRCKRNPTNRLNLAIFRLSCCCGLRRKEIAGLELRDLTLDGIRPTICVRPEITKGPKPRRRFVPLHWDAGTLYDLRQWRDYRVTCGAGPNDRVVASMQRNTLHEPLNADLVAQRWSRLVVGVLGSERGRQLSIHCGRHSFVSHALHCGRSLTEVRDAAGHANISTTSIYSHVLEREGIPDLFGPRSSD